VGSRRGVPGRSHRPSAVGYAIGADVGGAGRLGGGRAGHVGEDRLHGQGVCPGWW
jgi:hypothetical protein